MLSFRDTYNCQEGILSIEEVCTDGTKIEANVNKHTFVWKKAIATNREKMKKQLAHIWEYARSVAADEDNLADPSDLTTINKRKNSSRPLIRSTRYFPLAFRRLFGLPSLFGWRLSSPVFHSWLHLSNRQGLIYELLAPFIDNRTTNAGAHYDVLNAFSIQAQKGYFCFLAISFFNLQRAGQYK